MFESTRLSLPKENTPGAVKHAVLNQPAAARLVSAVVATAHGHATLMLDGTFGSGPQAAEAAARHAAAAALALIDGRQALA